MRQTQISKLTTKTALATALLFLLGCGAKFSPNVASNSSNADPLDDGNLNQKAHLVCTLTNSADVSSSRQIDSDSRVDTFTEPYLEGSVLSVDCAATTDEVDVSELSFRFSSSYTPEVPNLNPISGHSIDVDLPSPGRFPMAIEVEDAKGIKTIKTFVTVVRCVDGEAPTLDLAGVSVELTARLNYFNYSVDPASLGNGESFSFSWDFNGDSVYDPIGLTQPNIFWTEQSSLNDIYTIFANARTIGVKVRNECQLESYFKVAVDFPMDNIARAPDAEAVVKPYYYLQADIHGDPETEQRINGDYLATVYPEDAKLNRVSCDYNFKRNGEPAGYTITGHNWYKPKKTKGVDVAPFLHGMNIQVANVSDTGSTGLQTFTDAVLENANYKVSAADDGIVQESYNRSADCTVVIRIERLQPAAPCADDQKKNADFKEVDVLRIRGEFNCPQLSEGDQLVSATNGKFFCEVAPSDQCVGGGGGGGDPKPEQ